MSLYEIPTANTISQKEIHLYGSSRLGMALPESKPMQKGNDLGILHGGKCKIYTLVRGEKIFELSNHLGNVLATITDKKIQVPKASPNQAQIDYYIADVVSATDYYAFGMQMPGRSYTAPNGGYRYGFNGKEKDNSTASDSYDFGARIYDGRIGKFLSLDALQQKYPNETHYGFVSNNPIIYMDADGRDKILTLKVIGTDGKTTIKMFTEKNTYEYTKISTKGFGNDRYYKQDILVNTTIDLRSNTIMQSEGLGIRKEISQADYNWFKFKDFFGTTESRGSQPGGMTLTSKFSSQADGPKTDATEGSSGSINVDLLMAAFTALSKTNSIKDMPNLAEWTSLVKDVVEQVKSDEEKIGNAEKQERTSSAKKIIYRRLDDYGTGANREKKGSLQKGKYITDSVENTKPAKDGSGVDTIEIKNTKRFQKIKN